MMVIFNLLRQILFPWFPGIIIDPNKVTKEVKYLLKNIGAPYPTIEELESKDSAYDISKRSDKIYFIYLFNKKKNWLWLPQSKIKKFNTANNRLLLQNDSILSSKYMKELDKGYKKAFKILEASLKEKKETDAFFLFKSTKKKN
jgi:hypothetical protein